MTLTVLLLLPLTFALFSGELLRGLLFSLLLLLNLLLIVQQLEGSLRQAWIFRLQVREFCK